MEQECLRWAGGAPSAAPKRVWMCQRHILDTAPPAHLSTRSLHPDYQSTPTAPFEHHPTAQHLPSTADLSLPPVGVSDVPYTASVGLEGAIWVIAWMARDCRDPREANKVWPYKRVTAGALPRLPSSHLRYTIDCSLVYPYRPIPTRLCLCWLAALIHSTPRQIAN